MEVFLLLFLLPFMNGNEDDAPPASTLPPPPEGAPSPAYPPPAPEPEARPVPSDEAPISEGCYWRIVADGRTAELCGSHQLWRAVIDGDDGGTTYALPEAAISRIIHRLKLNLTREVEIEGATFRASISKRGGKWDWRVKLDQSLERGRVDTLLDALGEIWAHTGTP